MTLFHFSSLQDTVEHGEIYTFRHEEHRLPSKMTIEWGTSKFDNGSNEQVLSGQERATFFHIMLPALAIFFVIGEVSIMSRIYLKLQHLYSTSFTALQHMIAFATSGLSIY